MKRYTSYLAIAFALLLTVARASDDPAVHGNTGHDWYADAEITDAARERLGVQWQKCCNHAEVFRTEFRVNKEDGDDEWWYLTKAGTWKRLPNDIIHWGETAPDKQPTLFIYQGIEVCFWPGEGGG